MVEFDKSFYNYLDEKFSKRQQLTASDGEQYLEHLFSQCGEMKSAELQSFISRLVEFNLFLSENLFIKTFTILVPNEKLSQGVIQLCISYVIKHSIDPRCYKRTAIILDWLIAAIRYEVNPTEDFHSYYHLFVILLKYDHLVDQVAHLLYLISDFKIASNCVIRQVIRYSELHSENNSLKSLISLYNTYKPHLFAVRNSEIDKVNFEFIGIHSEMMKRFRRKYKRKSKVQPMSKIDSQNDSICWKNNKINNSYHYILEFSISNALKSYLNGSLYPLGTSIGSLLFSEYGYLFMLRSTDQIVRTGYKKAASMNILPMLNRIQDTNELDPVDKILLSKVGDFQSKIGYELSVTDQFITDILKFWEGKICQSEVFKLLSFFNITDYNNFYQNILLPLYKLMMKYDLEFYMKSLKTLFKIGYNNCFCMKHRVSCKLKGVTSKKIPNKKALLKFYNAIDHLVILCLNLFPDDTLYILNEVIEEYGIKCNAMKFLSPVEVVVMPTEFVLMTLLTKNLVLLNKIGYIIIEGFKNDQNNMHLHQQIQDIKHLYFGNQHLSRVYKNELALFGTEELVKKLPDVQHIKHSFNNHSYVEYLNSKYQSDKVAVLAYLEDNFEHYFFLLSIMC